MTSLLKSAFISFICSVTVILVTACSAEPPEPSGRPGGSGNQEPEPVSPPDYSHIVADPRLRCESTHLSLFFDDGGVIYSRSQSSHRFVDLSSGNSARFDSSTPELSINNEPVAIESYSVIRDSIGLQWIVIQPDTIIFVVEKG